MAVKIHIGRLIEKEVKRQNLSIAEFGRRINKVRASVYHIFRSSSVDSELLLTISLVLNKNFFAPYVAKLPEDEAEISLEKQVEELKKELELKDKLIALLEEKAKKTGD